jgi:NAD(P)-dependent dehydrogenase (short-subunit alcohol dehydrogenase family)
MGAEMSGLKGKTALVTGSSRGIGRGIALSLGAQGATVAVNYARDAEAAEATVRAIEAAGGQAFAVQADLEAPGAPRALAETVAAELARRNGDPGLDILVNNIGRAAAGTVTATTPEVFDEMVGVNLRAPFLLSGAVAPSLRQDGRVVIITSTAARLSSPDFAAYCVAKGALDTLVKVLSKELAPRRITVNAVSPGYTRTDQVAAVVNDPAKAKALADATLFGRLGEADDLGDFVAALCGDAGRWVTGQLIECSGGFRV